MNEWIDELIIKWIISWFLLLRLAPHDPKNTTFRNVLKSERTKILKLLFFYFKFYNFDSKPTNTLTPKTNTYFGIKELLQNSLTGRTWFDYFNYLINHILHTPPLPAVKFFFLNFNISLHNSQLVFNCIFIIIPLLGNNFYWKTFVYLLGNIWTIVQAGSVYTFLYTWNYYFIKLYIL